jgi:hypothetical protein
MNISNQPHAVFIRPAAQPKPIQLVQLPKPVTINQQTWHNISPGDPYDIKK